MTEPAPEPTATPLRRLRRVLAVLPARALAPAHPALHNVGTSLVVAVAAFALATARYWWLLAMPEAGYFFAWLAHFWIEKNRPATFTYPYAASRPPSACGGCG